MHQRSTTGLHINIGHSSEPPVVTINPLPWPRSRDGYQPVLHQQCIDYNKNKFNIKNSRENKITKLNTFNYIMHTFWFKTLFANATLSNSSTTMVARTNIQTLLV